MDLRYRSIALRNRTIARSRHRRPVAQQSIDDVHCQC